MERQLKLVFYQLLKVEIEQALNQADELTKKIVRHYFSEGSYKSVPSLFYVSQETYYRKVRKFLEKLANLSLKKS